MAPKAMGGVAVAVIAASAHRIITQVCMISTESLQLFHARIHSLTQQRVPNERGHALCQVQGHHEKNMQSPVSQQDAGVERPARKKPWRLEGKMLEKQDKAENG